MLRLPWLVYSLPTHRPISMNNAVWLIKALVGEEYAYDETSKRGQYLSEAASLGQWYNRYMASLLRTNPYFRNWS